MEQLKNEVIVIQVGLMAMAVLSTILLFALPVMSPDDTWALIIMVGLFLLVIIFIVIIMDLTEENERIL